MALCVYKMIIINLHMHTTETLHEWYYYRFKLIDLNLSLAKHVNLKDTLCFEFSINKHAQNNK